MTELFHILPDKIVQFLGVTILLAHQDLTLLAYLSVLEPHHFFLSDQEDQLCCTMLLYAWDLALWLYHSIV
jgi:hypothetical protein